ncbi:MAG: hypothetical protein NT062_00625 [Proteobacteria bacterium]|nr:hypothetical protein [Pseudomonadota bacterium]
MAANLPRIVAAAGGAAVLLLGGVACAVQVDTRWSGLVVVGLALIARAIWWRRGPAILALEGRGPRLAVLAACLLIVGMYTANRDMADQPRAPRGDGAYLPVLARGDGHMMYLMARSTALDLDWVFDDDLARFGDPWLQPVTATGRKGMVNPIGPALVWTPMIWLAEAGAVIANVVGADIALHGYTLWHQRIVFLSSALFACGAVLLGRRLARALLATSPRAWAPSYGAIAVLLGTPLTYYATFMPSYAHAMDACACAAFLAYWAHTLGRRDVRRWVTLGALLGVAGLVRAQELGLGIVVAVELVARVGARHTPNRTRLAWIGGSALAVVVTLVAFAPQLLEWHRVFGQATALPQGARFTRLGSPMIAEVLFAPRNGWFSSSPIAYAGTLGLFLLPRRARLVGLGLVAALALQVYLNSCVFDWWGGAAFGQRRMCNMTLPLVVGIATLVWRCGRLARRASSRLLHVLVVVGLGTFVTHNLARVGALAGGRPAGSELEPSCCDRVPASLRPFAQALYDRVGNPFELPASAVFALVHDVPITTWDQTVGSYPLVPPTHTLLDDSLWKQRGRWPLWEPALEPFLIGGFGPSSMLLGRHARLTTAPVARMLVPNLMPYGQRVALWLAPAGASQVTVRWNGEEVARAMLYGWTRVTFDLPTIGLHTNELAIEGQGGAVGVGDLDLEFLPK